MYLNKKLTGAVTFAYALYIVLYNIRFYAESNSTEVNLILFPSGTSQRPKNTFWKSTPVTLWQIKLMSV